MILNMIIGAFWGLYLWSIGYTLKDKEYWIGITLFAATLVNGILLGKGLS